MTDCERTKQPTKNQKRQKKRRKEEKKKRKKIEGVNNMTLRQDKEIMAKEFEKGED